MMWHEKGVLNLKNSICVDADEPLLYVPKAKIYRRRQVNLIMQFHTRKLLPDVNRKSMETWICKTSPNLLFSNQKNKIRALWNLLQCQKVSTITQAYLQLN